MTSSILFHSLSGYNWPIIRSFYASMLFAALLIAVVSRSSAGTVAAILFLIYTLLTIPRQIEVHQNGLLISYFARKERVKTDRIAKIFVSGADQEVIFTIMVYRLFGQRSIPFKPRSEDVDPIIEHFESQNIQIHRG